MKGPDCDNDFIIWGILTMIFAYYYNLISELFGRHFIFELVIEIKQKHMCLYQINVTYISDFQR